MLRITPKQARTVHRLARDQCCNCTDGNCLLLDDGGYPKLGRIKNSESRGGGKHAVFRRRSRRHRIKQVKFPDFINKLPKYDKNFQKPLDKSSGMWYYKRTEVTDAYERDIQKIEGPRVFCRSCRFYLAVLHSG